MKTSALISIKILLVLTVITGIIYPLFITGIVQVIFPDKANGSLIRKNGDAIGSHLIGQAFDSSIYFWPRPSAIGYAPLPSSGSNFGPTNDKLRLQVEERRNAFITAHQLDQGAKVPDDMLFASSSGLDPHISPASALLQVGRVADARGFSEPEKNELIALVHRLTEKPQFGFLGNERVNVLRLNLELEQIK
jgi:K+-transporting ATPase ATPase C chain